MENTGAHSGCSRIQPCEEREVQGRTPVFNRKDTAQMEPCLSKRRGIMPHIAHDTPRMRDTSRKRSTPRESKNKKGTLACSSLALSPLPTAEGNSVSPWSTVAAPSKASPQSLASQGSNKKQHSAFGKHTPQSRNC